MTTRKMMSTTVMKEATTAPLTLWQKSLNCWQMASQLASELPLWARYTIAAEAPPADVARVTASCTTQKKPITIAVRER